MTTTPHPTHPMIQTSLPFAPIAADRLGNRALAAHLSAIADSLEAARDNPHRIRAYRAAAASVAEHPRAVAELSRPALEEIPGVGPRIAGVLRDHVESRPQGMLERLHRGVGTLDHLTLLDGVGDTLAERIRSTLGVDGLEALAERIDELETVDGIGEKKAKEIRDSLHRILERRRAPVRAHRRPPVRLLLEVDGHYRRAVAEGGLPTIASSLPILRTSLEGWSFRAMFSTTELAHDRGRTDDWVVIFAEREGAEAQATVVTETRGMMAGRRVVRGREGESRRHHLDQQVTLARHAA